MNISLENITISFKNKKIYDNLNLEIKSGDFLAITGPSGCGKSTLLNVIGLLLKPQSGTIKFANSVINSEKKILLSHRYDIGYLFQNFALIENKSIFENMLIGMMYSKMRKNEKRVECEKALKQVGLEEKIDDLVYTLSGGQQQRVALAKLIVKPCKVILADEPTGNLDHENMKVVINILKKFNEQGKTIILVTHDEELACAAKKQLKI